MVPGDEVYGHVELVLPDSSATGVVELALYDDPGAEPVASLPGHLRRTDLAFDWSRFGPHLNQGAAFAAKARLHAGNPTERAEMACRVLCGCSAESAAAATDLAKRDLPVEQAVPAYESWRRRVVTLLTG